MSLLKRPIETKAELEELERLLHLKDSLPHLFGFPWYDWAYKFFHSENKVCFLVSANQVSKSSTQIRKIIDWATDTKMWKKRWPTLLPGQKPNCFWYFYPTKETWQAEFESKWVPDFLPRGPYKDDPVYGWKEEYEKGYVSKINFNSGVTIYCKSYKQKVTDLQTGSVHYLAGDEEIPIHFIPEFQARLRATNGYWSSVFTATLGQEYWRMVMEPKASEEEIYPRAFKQQISLYDCQKYRDGALSRWTDERILEIIAECTSEAEVQRRVFGRFVKSEGLRYASFDIERNMMAPEPIPKSWGIFSGVDPGSGGLQGHPAAIIFIAVRPDYKEGWVFRGWRGDKIQTANPDILAKFRDLKGDLVTMSQVYDYKDKDFFLVAQSAGEPFCKANKARDEGFGLVNSLLKNGMLKIFKGDSELAKLVSELLSVPITEDKRKLLDDLCDSARYTAMSIPWDFSGVIAPSGDKDKDPPPDKRTAEQIALQAELKARREFVLNTGKDLDDDIANDFEFWNELAGND
jgi:hypothetical protein